MGGTGILYSNNGLFEFHLHILNLQLYEIVISRLHFFYSEFVCANFNFYYLAVIPFVIKGLNVTPVKSYLNADKDKKLLYDENKKKFGIYCWTNLTNNKCYIGSSSNLAKRLSWYYNIENLNKRFDISLICRALLKYGYSGFRLDILEYCEIDKLLEREQFYIDTIKPEYNILLVAGSSLGHKHSEKTLAKLTGRKLSLVHLTKLRKHLTQHNASDEQRIKARARMLKLNEAKGMKIEVLDTVTKEITTYNSIRQAAAAIGCTPPNVRGALKAFSEKGTERLIKQRFIVKKVK